MRISVAVGLVVVLLAGVVFLLVRLDGDASMRDAAAAVGCHGISVNRPRASPGLLQVSASDCFKVGAGSSVAPEGTALALLGRAVWESDLAKFSTLSLTVYRGSGDGRLPRSVLLSAVQCENWFGPRHLVPTQPLDSVGAVAAGLLWVLLPVAGLAWCALVLIAMRSGRLTMLWIIH